MIEGYHYQNAYVTRDLDKAVAEFRKYADIRKEILHEANMDVTTPAGKGKIHSKIALLWVDNLQYEFIQPLGGMNEVYRDALAAAEKPVFHHICKRVEDWDRFRARVKEQAWPVVLEGEGSSVKFVYLDARAALGHIVEYTWMAPGAWTAMGGL